MKKALFGLFAMVLLSCHNPSTEKNPQNFSEYKNYLTELNDIDPAKVSILIEKSRYKLSLLEAGKVIKSYPIVLGPNPVSDKLMEGDGCTPEGKFKLRAKYPHAKWSKFLWVDYPTKDSWKKHNAAKSAGKIPKNASIGGEIGIHGVPNKNDKLISNGTNWTLGCISLRTKDIEELYKYVQVGTIVEIKH